MMEDYLKHYKDELDTATAHGEAGEMGMVRKTMGSLVETLMEKIWIAETGGTCKKVTFPAINPDGDTYNFSVDRHCFLIDGKLKLLVECKAYLDKCYLERASSNYHFIKQTLRDDVDCIVLALESTIGDDAYKFFMGYGYVDHCFFLLDGTRDSNYPIWRKEHRKEINKQKLTKFIDYVNTLK